MLRKKGEGGLDTDVSEATTMTDMSDDDEGDVGETVTSSSSPRSPVSPRSILEKRRQLNRSHPSTPRSDDEDDQDDKKSQRSKQRHKEEQEDDLGSDDSLDEPAKPTKKGLKIEKHMPKRIQANKAGSEEEEGSDVESEKEAKRKEAEEKKLEAAKIAKQEQELRAMQEKLKKLEQETNENKLVDILVSSKTPEYSHGYPISGPILFRACQHYSSFVSGSNSLLKKIATAIETQVNQNQKNFQNLTYWLSTSIVLLNLVQKEHPISDSLGHDATDRTITISTPNDPLGNDPKGIEKEEAPSPAYLYQKEFGFENPIAQFRSDLMRSATEAYVYLLQSSLEGLVQVLITSMFASLGKNGRMNASHTTKILSEQYTEFSTAHVYPPVMNQFFGQIYRYINYHTFNALVATGGAHCTMGSAIMLKMAVSELEEWASSKNFDISQELTTLRQSCDIMIMNKSNLIEASTRKEICGNLTNQQVRRVLQLYHPDEYDPDAVPANVLRALPEVNVKSQDVFVDTSVIDKPNFYFEKPDIPLWKSVRAPQSLASMQEFDFYNSTK
ncbi:hypothetical protein AKO1_008281 [Acrasis kona]|uniref:Dilute domain-containing protein n=1 Tax=Acrasis kona TaxID=1008807 RepID=A0AAW2YNJ5_9EUKA